MRSKEDACKRPHFNRDVEKNLGNIAEALFDIRDILKEFLERAKAENEREELERK